MLAFFISYLRSNPLRNISIIIITIIIFSINLFIVFLYQNSTRALKYYQYRELDTTRFTLSQKTNIIDMFSKRGVGIPDSVIEKLNNDPNIRYIEAYSLVELPVLAKFGLFDFGLETDIPVFSVSEGVLTGASVPVGISRALVDFYNLQIAGTSRMFPYIPERFVRGQGVTLVFGDSKIFPSLPNISSPLEGTITTIHDNFPGFGIVLPEQIVRMKLAEIGYSLAQPYKIVAYMKDESFAQYMRDTYFGYHLLFDSELSDKMQGKIDILRMIFFSLGIFLFFIFSIIFYFLLAGFYRERHDIFSLLYIFSLGGIRARILTLGEPIFLVMVGGVMTLLLGYYGISLITLWGNNFLIGNGISFFLTPISDELLFSGVLLSLGIIIIGIFLIEFLSRFHLRYQKR